MPRRGHDSDDRDADNGRDDRRRRRKKRIGTGGILLIIGGIALVCGGCLAGVGYFTRHADAKGKSSNKLRWMALAMQEYESAKGELPANTFTAGGKPLLSWRVHLLPYVEGDKHYKEFKLNEPWDSPHNRLLLPYMPDVYRFHGNTATPPGFTHYRGFSSPGAVFDRRRVHDHPVRPGEELTFDRFKDGLNETVLVVVAADPVEWTKPDDLDASPGKPFPKMANFHLGGRFLIVLADGSARDLRPNVPEAAMRALVTHSGGEQLPPNWDD